MVCGACCAGCASTSATGSIVSEHDFLPLGEERTSIGQHQAKGYDREEPLRFTGHERDFDNTAPNDSSSFIDYMHARYYATTSGRFLSVDPIIPSALAVRNQPGDFVANATRESAQRTARRLANTSATLADLVEAGKLKIVAAIYDLDSGKVEYLA